MNYYPKDQMCASCKRKDDNCSALPFNLMPSLDQTEIDGDQTIIVRCTWYERREEETA